jgi:ABC-2 type transport system ATP-binding protein
MIHVSKLSKSFTVHRKQAGLGGSIKSLFKRDNLVKRAVDEVSFEVNEGEIVGLVGANGAGKTTLVKMLSGIIHPTSGEARVLGFNPIERKNALRRQIALIMGQKAQLWWDLPAADCFLLLKEIYKIPEKKYRDTLHFLAETLQVSGQLNIQIRRLSLGERMKMELIAALLHQPRVVYLDEPTIGLDLTAQRSIRSFLLNYRQEHKPAMLLTSHYMEDIEQLCKRILIIREGQMVYDGLLQDVIKTHARHKVISLDLQEGAPTGQELCELIKPHLGSLPETEVIETSESRLRVRTLRDIAPNLAGKLIATLPVHDLSVEEIDIGTIIEGLLHTKNDSLEAGS